jgi:glutamate carboxypeptidase
MKRLLACGLALLLPSLPVLAQLTPTETRLASYIDSNAEQALALLIESVNINSGTMNLAGVRHVGELLMPEYERLGFEVQWLDGSAWERAGHLTAYRAAAAADAPKVLLIGHLDTVFEPDSPFQRFEALADGRARGPGVLDMKGGNLIMLQALAALHAEGALDALDLTVVLTGDEELSGSPLALSKAALIQAAQHADIAIGFEDGDGSPTTANISRRGSVGWTLEVTGTPAHSSQIFSADVGPGAIFEAARILEGFHAELRNEELLTFNPGLIMGGTTIDYSEARSGGEAFGKDNVVAETTLVTGDIRAVSEEQLQRVKSRMEAIVAAGHPNTTARIRFSEGYPPMAPTAANQSLLELYSKGSVDLGLGEVTAVNPLLAGAADVSFTAAYVEMAIDGLGMSGSGGHTVNETGDLTALTTQAQRTALLLYRLSRRGE